MRDSAFDFNDLGSSRRFFGKRSQRDGQREAALFGKARLRPEIEGPGWGFRVTTSIWQMDRVREQGQAQGQA